MSIPCPEILTLHDSKKFQESMKTNPAMEQRTESEHIITRPRGTRRPRRIFTLGFTDISQEQKVALMGLWQDALGSSVIISDWPHPTENEIVNDEPTGNKVTYNVRFAKQQIPNFTYRGAGHTYRWDVSNVVLEEV